MKFYIYLHKIDQSKVWEIFDGTYEENKIFGSNWILKKKDNLADQQNILRHIKQISMKIDYVF